MSTFAVVAERLTILPHNNADALELAEIGGYHAVVAKGEYKTGDYALYIPEQAILPPELLQELGLEGKLAGSSHNRVKAVRLRGEVSQGIVCRPKAINYLDLDTVEEGWDFAPLLGITKYEPVIPQSLSGEMEGCPDFVPWIEIENIKKYPDWFKEGDRIHVSEKIHGSCLCITAVSDEKAEDGYRLYVSSKGLGQKHLAIKESASNAYWTAVRANPGISQLAHSLLKGNKYHGYIALFGELYGSGVQDLHYGLENGEKKFVLFDIHTHYGWLSQLTVKFLGERYKVDVVPEIDIPTFDLAILQEAAEQPSILGGGIREGLVIRAVPERRNDEGDRLILKMVSDKYLFRKGEQTEYE